METEWKFCTIEIGGKEYECTVKKIEGVSQPKDVWYGNRWLSIGMFKKEVTGNYSAHSYRDSF